MPIVKPYAFGELFSVARAGAAWDFDPAGALVQVAANAPRVDYDPATLAARGLLVEEAATNQARNPRREGAAAGSPGTPPTDWGFVETTGFVGLTRTIALGVEDGLACVDFRWTGTATAAGNIQHFTLAPDQAASVGQTWTYAPFCVVSGPSLPASARVRLIELPAFAATEVFFPVGAAPLRQSRRVVTRTLTDGATASLRTNIWVTVASGVTYDFTVRIAAPQLWQSPLTFSPSFPPVGTPGPSARAADDLSALDIGAWFNASAGTFVIEFTPGQTTSPAHRGLVTVDDGTGANEFRLRMLPGATTVRLSVDVAGAEVFGIQQASGAALTRHTARFSYGPAGWLLSVNGAAPVSGAGPIPAGLVRALIGRGLAAGEYLNGWLGPRFAYYPVQYTDTAAPDGFTIRTR